uniref:Uncharacterized protein n=1 Tax=Romanomermis culicivorax TaxID=13658 RepID=A0A915JF03_ROMCU
MILVAVVKQWVGIVGRWLLRDGGCKKENIIARLESPNGKFAQLGNARLGIAQMRIPRIEAQTTCNPVAER